MIRRVVACAIVAGCAAGLFAQDPVKVSPGLTRVPLENEKVRVFESHIPPGKRLPMHSHPQYVAYALTSATLRFTTPAGATRDLEVAAGQAVWRDPETHAIENLSTTTARILHVELKQ